MKAETALNVIQVLSDTEKQRLFEMLGVSPKLKEKKRDTRLSEAEAADIVEAIFSNARRKRLLNK